MTPIYIVSDPLGISEAFLTFEEGKEKFEKLIAACRQSQKGNPTFRCHFDTVNENGLYIKQFKSRYKNSQGFWTNEVYAFQKAQL